MFHRELKINFGELDRAADALDWYARMLTRLTEGLQLFGNAIEGASGEAYEALMQKKRQYCEMIVRELSAVTDTGNILRSYIRDMTAVISPDIWGQPMLVDRNDIWGNLMTMEEKIMHLANIGYYATVSSWDIYTIAPDIRTRKAEERYYKQVETVREDIIPAYYRRIQSLMAEMTRIYQEKVVVYENTDDEYQGLAELNYQKHKEYIDTIGKDAIAFLGGVRDFVHGATDGIEDMLKGNVTEAQGNSMCYIAAGAACAFCTKAGVKPPEWAEEEMCRVEKSGQALSGDPWLLAEGIAQGASDALEQKGISYCAGYIIGPILATKGIAEGISRLRAAVAVKQARKALTAEEAAAQGADDVGRAAAGANETINGFDKTVNAGKQAKHILGNNNYIEGRSIFNGTVDDAQRLVDEFAGTGEWIGQNKERVNFGNVIGIYVNPSTGERVNTTIGIIHYSKTGTHIVPAQPIE